MCQYVCFPTPLANNIHLIQASRILSILLGNHFKRLSVVKFFFSDVAIKIGKMNVG